MLLPLVYGLGGLIGGFFLGEGISGAFASARSFLIGGIAGGALVALVALFAVGSAPMAALLYPVLSAGIGGYLLGSYLEKKEEEAGEW